MTKLFTMLFAIAVASVTALAQAQAPAKPAAPASATAQATAQKTVAAPAGAKSIEAKVAMCIGCHGIKGYQASFPEIHKVPMISGQSAKYTVAALSAYKAGDRKHPTMHGIADSLSEQDMNDIGAYYEASGKSEGKAPGEKAN